MLAWAPKHFIPSRASFATWKPAAAVALAALAIAVWAHTLGPDAGAGYDFKSYVEAARTIAAGGNPYHRLIVELESPQVAGQAFSANGYIYPPLLATVFAALVAIGASEQALWVIWIALNVGATLWLGHELNRGLRGARDWPTTLLFASACALPAVVIYDLSLGQTDLLMAALAVGACSLWLRGGRWAPLALGIGIATKPTLALLALAWLWKRDWRAVIATGLIALALIFAPFLVAGGAHGLSDYWTFFTRWNAFQNDGQCINQSAYGAALRAVATNPCVSPLVSVSPLVTPLRLALILLAAGVWLRATPRDTTPGAAGMFELLLALPVLLIVSPLSEDIHYCLLAPVVVASVWLAATRQRFNHPDGVASLIAVVLLLIPRMQEMIYPDHLFRLPGQSNNGPGLLIAQARADILFLLACVTLLAGVSLLAERRPAPARPARAISATTGEGAITDVHC